jgi:hypothetical protein
LKWEIYQQSKIPIEVKNVRKNGKKILLMLAFIARMSIGYLKTNEIGCSS